MAEGLPCLSKRQAREAVAFQLFARRYARKARRNRDPNDRVYDRDIERVVRRMPPERLDAILRAGDE